MNQGQEKFMEFILQNVEHVKNRNNQVGYSCLADSFSNNFLGLLIEYFGVCSFAASIITFPLIFLYIDYYFTLLE